MPSGQCRVEAGLTVHVAVAGDDRQTAVLELGGGDRLDVVLTAEVVGVLDEGTDGVDDSTTCGSLNGISWLTHWS